MSDWWDTGSSWAGKSDEYTCCKIIWRWEEETVNRCWVIDKSTCHVFWWAYQVSSVTLEADVSKPFRLFENHFTCVIWSNFTVDVYSSPVAWDIQEQWRVTTCCREESFCLKLWQPVLLKIPWTSSYYLTYPRYLCHLVMYQYMSSQVTSKFLM